MWVCIDWCRYGKPGMVGLCVGAVAGLATITPAAGFVQPWAAAVIGFMASIFCYLCVEFRKWCNWDDALDVWGVHGMGGALGSIMLGALGSINGVDASAEFFGKQLAAVALTAFYSFFISFVSESEPTVYVLPPPELRLCSWKGLVIIKQVAAHTSSVTAPSQALLKIIDSFTPLKPEAESMASGLDMHLHGESACKDTDLDTCPGCSNPPSLNPGCSNPHTL